MKKIFLSAIFILAICSFAYSQNVNNHDASSDNKSVSKINIDYGSTNGVVTLQPVNGTPAATVLQVPITNAILLGNIMHDNHVNGINWTDAFITGKAINWSDIKAYGSSFGGDHSGINWTSFGI
jgi:hypothetical protein